MRISYTFDKMQLKQIFNFILVLGVASANFFDSLQYVATGVSKAAGAAASGIQSGVVTAYNSASPYAHVVTKRLQEGYGNVESYATQTAGELQQAYNQ